MPEDAKRPTFIDNLSLDVSERFDNVDWNKFNAYDKMERVEIQTQVLQIRNDLMTVAAVDPARAAKIWDEHVPTTVPRPVELPQLDAAPPTLEAADAVPGRQRRPSDLDKLAKATGELLSQVNWEHWNDERPEYRNITLAGRGKADKLFDRLLERDPLRASGVWDENVPGYVTRPYELQRLGPFPEPDRANGIELGRTRRKTQAEPFLDECEAIGGPKSEKAAGRQEKAEKEASDRSARAPGPDPLQPSSAGDGDPAARDLKAERARMLLAGVERRYLKVDDRYHFRDGRENVAFEVKDKKLATAYEFPVLVSAMVDVAEARGWSSLKLSGTSDFRREAWLQASLRNIEVSGYAPTKADKALLDELREERGPAAPSNVIAQPPKAARRAEMGSKFETLGEDGIPEARLPLTPAQDQHLRLMEATMRHRGDAPTAIVKAREMAQAKLTSERVHVGTLVEVGSAPYQDKPGQKLSHYVVLQDEQGERSKVWGVDLPRALKASGAQPGEKIAVAFRGRQPVTVDVPIKDRGGETVRVEPRVVDRNTWEVIRFDRLRQDVKASIARIVERQSNPADVKVFDRRAPPVRQPIFQNRNRDRGQGRERSL